MTSEATLTLREIADLAHVKRAVVSMWRRRPRSGVGVTPFPEPVAQRDGQDHFDRNAVVAWLLHTKRGNNPDVALEALATTPPPKADPDTVSALLALHALSGQLPGEIVDQDMVETARRWDPDDEYLLSEVSAARSEPSIVQYVDDLLEASYGPADALERLQAGRLTRQTPTRGLDPRLLDLVAAVAAVGHERLGEHALLIPPNDLSLARRLVPDFDGIIAAGTSDIRRAVHRSAVINEVESTTSDNAAVRVLSVVGASEADALDQIDQAILDLPPTAICIVIGPASVLCDRLTGTAEEWRAKTLRPGVLVFAARLPRGLWKEAHRQSLALWVVEGGRTRPSFWAADLSDPEIDLDDLASDVAAALRATDVRAYRYARNVDLAAVLAGDPVVSRGIGAVRARTADPTSYRDSIFGLTLITDDPLPGFDIEVGLASGQITLPQRSLAELRDLGHVTMKRGCRIDPTTGDEKGTVRVRTGDGSLDHLRLDPLEAERRYPRANRTEPGDVIFLARDRPAAIVDVDGGSLVAAPSRILRLSDNAPIGPHALAGMINNVVPPQSEWETWPVPILPSSQAKTLDAALADASNHLAQLHRREQATKDLTIHLIQGVAAGAVTINGTTKSTTMRKAG
jgi:hypothetical protein